MAGNVEFLRTAEHQLTRIDRTWQARLLDYLEDHVATRDEPRQRGKPLTGDQAGLWRYRVGDYSDVQQMCAFRTTVISSVVEKAPAAAAQCADSLVAGLAQCFCKPP